MWVYTSRAFISAVAHRHMPGHLMVRARLAGDLEDFFGPKVEVIETRLADYRFRTVVPAEVFAAALVAAASEIDYPNFKGSISDRNRHDAYLGCWWAMNSLQEQLYPPVYGPAGDLFGAGLDRFYHGPIDDGSVDAMSDEEFYTAFGDPAADRYKLEADASGVTWCPDCGSDITADLASGRGVCPYCGVDVA